MAIHGEILWVTGASSGLGLALVERLAHSNQVIVSGRRIDELNKLAQKYPSISVLGFDITNKSELTEVKSKLHKLVPHLDRIILNAGACEYFDSENPDWDLFEKICNVNYLGAVNCLNVGFELLKKSERGHLVGIGSQAAVAPFTRAEAYGASKAALHYFLDSMRIDLRRFSIDVTVVMPGFIDTPLTRKNRFSMPWLMTTEKAAQRVISAMADRPLRYTFPYRLYLLLIVSRLFPRWWLKRQVAAADNNKPHRHERATAEIRER